MKIKTGIKRRDELAVCIRDMTFVICGVVLVCTGHLYWAVAAFIGAAFRFELGNAYQYIKSIMRIRQETKRSIARYDQAVKSIIDTALENGAIDREKAEEIKKSFEVEK